MRTFSQTFAGAQTWILNVPGNYFTTLACTLAVTVRFYKNGQQLNLGECNSLLAGLEVSPPVPADGYAFDEVRIDVGGADTVQIGIGDGSARYNRSQGNVAVTNTGGAFTHAQASVTNVDNTILAANTARRYCLVQNNSTAGVLRLVLDGTAATATKGVRIQPGGSYEVQGYCVTNAIRAFMETADATANNVEVVAG